MQNQFEQPWKNLPPSPPLLRPKQVLKATGLSRSTMYEMIARGEFPSFLRVGPRTSAMPETWLQAYLESCTKIE